MRIILFILSFALLSPVMAQDFCKHIKKEVSPDNKLFDYSSPVDPQEVTTILVTRSINIDPDYESDNFLIIFNVVGELESIYTKSAEGEQTEKEEMKIIIDFEDKSQIADDTVRISHDVTSDKLQAIRIAYYPLTEANLKDFTTKKITKITLAGHEKAVLPENANAIMRYVDCMKKAK